MYFFFSQNQWPAIQSPSIFKLVVSLSHNWITIRTIARRVVINLLIDPWRYHVFARKLTSHFIGVYKLKKLEKLTFLPVDCYLHFASFISVALGELIIQCCHTDFEFEKKKFGKVYRAMRPPLFFASKINSRITWLNDWTGQFRYFKIQL